MDLVGELLQPTFTGLLLSFLLFLLLGFYLISSKTNFLKEGKEPPGPKPLPVLGNLFQIDLKRPHLSLCAMAKQYGPVFTVYLGPKKVVVLAGYQTVKQALVSYAEEFGGREVSPLLFDFTKGHGISFANGDTWKEMRRFALSTLRDFGMGKRLSETKIIDETKYLIKVFESFNGKPFDTKQPISYAVSNIISAILYGSRFEYNDSQFTSMVNRADENVKLSGTPSLQLYNMFPLVRGFLKNWRLAVKNRNENTKQIKELADNLQETLNHQEVRGLVDCFFVQKKMAEDAGDSKTHYHEQNLLATVSNLFAAGTDTSSSTLRWGLLLMTKYTHVQARVQEEIDRVVEGRQLVVDDRKNLPYTDAVIHETQRFANILPISLAHITNCDVNFQGYFIKKGTSVIPLLASVLKDESEWESPHTFNPSHFLDKQGQFIKREAFIPFSAGRRMCLGEGLARMELFLFFASLLQHFHFTLPPGVSEEELDLTPAMGFILSPTPHQLCAIVRNAKLDNFQLK